MSLVDQCMIPVRIERKQAGRFRGGERFRIPSVGGGHMRDGGRPALQGNSFKAMHESVRRQDETRGMTCAQSGRWGLKSVGKMRRT
jgi:hypothetical protein